MTEARRSPAPPESAAAPEDAPRSASEGRSDAADPLAWLRRIDDPRVIAFLEEENGRTERVMRPLAGLRERLYEELRGRIQETDRSAPVRIDDFFYYHRTEEGKAYRIWARTPGPDGDEEVLLDENELASGLDYFRVGPLAVDPGHAHLAYAYDTTGDEEHTLVVKDLASGDLLSERIRAVADSIAWGERDGILYYTTRDASKRACRVWLHRLGDDPADDLLVYEEGDEAFHVYLRKSRSRRFVLIEVSSAITAETWILDAHDPGDPPWRFLRRRQGVEYDVEDAGDAFLVRTNEGARQFRLLRVPVSDDGPGVLPGPWEEVRPHRDDVMLEGVEAFRDFLVFAEREDGLPRLRVVLREPGATELDIPVPDPVYSIEVAENPEYASDRLRYVYSSPVTPRTTFDLEPRTGESRIIKRDEVPGFDPDAYEATRLWAVADDGCEIPISLLRSRRSADDGAAPCLLTGYGAYGISFDARFDPHVLSLCDRGFAYAIAHVRGGGEFGDRWHDQGKMLRKTTSFTDFIRCAERLIEAGLTRPERLGIQGRSAGGLLVGAVVNLRPDLFRAAIAGVPFVDVLATMLDPTIPLTVIEYEEWGDPRDPRYHDYIRSYSPLDNVREAEYPHMLVTAGLNDPRVQYWEPARWVARLRERRKDDGLLLLKTDLGAGHTGPSDRYEWLRERAFEYGFLISTLGDEPRHAHA